MPVKIAAHPLGITFSPERNGRGYSLDAKHAKPAEGVRHAHDASRQSRTVCGKVIEADGALAIEATGETAWIHAVSCLSCQGR
jgi:hypothetical protein